MPSSSKLRATIALLGVVSLAAACRSTGSSDSVQPYVGQLGTAQISLSADMTWAVSEVAPVRSGSPLVVIAFSVEATPERLVLTPVDVVLTPGGGAGHRTSTEVVLLRVVAREAGTITVEAADGEQAVLRQAGLWTISNDQHS
ncbi:MAG: hypothetical protein AAF581_10170 [Planctomycetota bacterium]